VATIEQLNALMDRRQQPATVVPPTLAAADLTETVNALCDIARALDESAKSRPQAFDPSLREQCAQMVKASEAIARALTPIASAIQSIEFPAPVVNVAPSPVTVERAPFPRIAKVQRNQDGYIDYVKFSDEEVEVQKDDRDGVMLD